ncbi:hypothetical protein C8Q74DRAFT_1288373 [Fomes fomentarius]|nr:hypothetical protein C8Q74DRAFT_1288373 [Fomes fomentarius]
MDPESTALISHAEGSPSQTCAIPGEVSVLVACLLSARSRAIGAIQSTTLERHTSARAPIGRDCAISRSNLSIRATSSSDHGETVSLASHPPRVSCALHTKPATVRSEADSSGCSSSPGTRRVALGPQITRGTRECSRSGVGNLPTASQFRASWAALS